ncbi:Di-copper centre-containing protein [Xylariaceae sp. FL1272]|nr:Di-copper centre-containing protein [Xylariaceae sp. FL1272]
MAHRSPFFPFFILSVLFWSHVCLGGGVKYDYGRNFDLRNHKRDSSQSSVVVGAPLLDGEPQPRLEIRELEKDKEAWTLYLLAQSWMQYTPQDSPFSWYQMAGIHGAPGLTWGNVNATPGNEDSGYCHHVSILFPTWHRPYLALYEQTMYQIVQMISALYPPEDRDRYQRAAKRFRLPYWDWALTPPEGESVLPLSVGGSPNVNVSGPNGIQNISNPLFSYTFRPFNGSIFPDAPYNTWNETKRAPFPTTAPDAISDNSAVAKALDAHLPSYQQRLYNLFANYDNYTTFSNEAWIGSSSNGSFDSIESLHDSIHTIGGGQWGHLAIIAYSAFDPLFFLHHANVDRIFAMWQILYNDTYVVPTAANYSTHTQDVGVIEDIDTPLTPFFSNLTSFWTSDMIRDHTTLGYTYADVTNKSRGDVVAVINRMYTDHSPASTSLRETWQELEEAHRFSHDQVSRSAGQPRSLSERALAWQHNWQNHIPAKAVFQGNSYREWIANIAVKKHALSASFSVYLFMGVVPGDSSTWQASDNLIGSLGVFANNKYMKNEGSITGTIPLTSALMGMVASGHVPSLDSEDVEPFLERALKMRIALINGTVVEAKDVDGLCVSIVSSLVEAPTKEDELSRWGEVEAHFDLFP